MTVIFLNPFLLEPAELTVTYLVVAGGGAGGSVPINPNSLQPMGAGAGGAGGLLQGSFTATVGQTYSLQVGAGGAVPTQGSNTVFNTQTAIGGGRGGYATSGTNQPLQGGSGGSGGSAYAHYSPGSGTAGQGNSGGTGQSQSQGGAYETHGGGGGAGAVGGNGYITVVYVWNERAGAYIPQSTYYCGTGGNGVQSSITGTATYYAGGGSGTNESTVNPTSGGLGGGGFQYSAGSANTGGGGASGGSGGSGVVILKIPESRSAVFSAGVASSMSTAVSGFRVYTVTAAGVSDTVTFA